jgi:hypothetical protein
MAVRHSGGGPMSQYQHAVAIVKTLKVRRTTLKAFANSSPGFALKPWVQKDPQEIFHNSEGVAIALHSANVDSTLSELRLREMNGCSSGLPKRNPGLELANAFSVVRGT